MEAKEYMQAISFKNSQKYAKTTRKIPINAVNKPSFLNNEGFTDAIENIVNFCEDNLLREAPRRLCTLLLKKYLI